MDANTWDRALVKGTCTLELPTPTLLESMIRKNSRLSSSTSSRKNQPASTGPVIHNHVHFGSMASLAGEYGEQAPFATSNSTQRAAVDMERSSPVNSDSDPEVEVTKYIEDLKKKEKTPKQQALLHHAMQKLLDEGLSVSQIRKLKDSHFKAMDIPLGTQMKLQDNAKPYKRKFKEI